jgi:hypothetical protein
MMDDESEKGTAKVKRHLKTVKKSLWLISYALLLLAVVYTRWTSNEVYAMQQNTIETQQKTIDMQRQAINTLERGAPACPGEGIARLP